MKHKKTLIVVLVFITAVLGIVCAVSIYYNFCGGFYFSRISKYAFILGEDNEIVVDGAGAYTTACNFSGTTLLNNDIRQDIFIKTNNLQTPLYLRAKMNIVGNNVENNNSGIIFGYTNWVQKDDGYIYFNQILLENEQIGLCRYVRFNENLKLESNVDYILVITVEASITPFENSED